MLAQELLNLCKMLRGELQSRKTLVEISVLDFSLLDGSFNVFSILNDYFCLENKYFGLFANRSFDRLIFVFV